MSGYHYFSSHFVMRVEREAARDVLAAVAAGAVPDVDALARVHPVPRDYLADIGQLLLHERQPWIGAPVRLARDGWSDRTRLSITFCLHDDEFAYGGYMFWLWVLSLVQPPAAPGAARAVIGYEGWYPNDYEMEFTIANPTAITGGRGFSISYQEIDELLADWSSWESWRP